MIAAGELAERIREVRVECFGERGEAMVAGLLGIPARTWSNYEAGVVVPAHVLLAFMELTGACPGYLLRGGGRMAPPGSALRRWR